MVVSQFVQTYTGRRLYFDDPDPVEIDLTDIAQALLHLNRFTGHAGRYSVATHSVAVLHCAIEMGADRATQRAALMHDAHEAYVGDVSTPLKRVLGPAWAAVERRVEQAVVSRFGLQISADQRRLVHLADSMVTHAEARLFLGPTAHEWALYPWDRFDAIVDTLPSFVQSCADLRIR